MNPKTTGQKVRQNRTLFISMLLLTAIGVFSMMFLLVQMTIAGSEALRAANSDATLATEPMSLLMAIQATKPTTVPTLVSATDLTSLPDAIQMPISASTSIPMPTTVTKSINNQNSDKVAYLTFDDGPSERTAEITQILFEYDVKATFFVLNKNDERSKQIIKQTAELGHTIGMHGASHNYSTIYKSADAFNRNLDLNNQYIWELTGIHPSVIRFPGGSLTVRNFPRRADIFRAVSDRGYVYFDWNCSSGDSNPKTQAPDVILKNILQTAVGKKIIVVLMHDSSGKRTTVEALPSIIEALRDKGYGFERLTDEVLPVHAFGSTVLYKNPVVRYNSIRYGE